MFEAMAEESPQRPEIKSLFASLCEDKEDS
jgi:hypothetical protein